MDAFSLYDSEDQGVITIEDVKEGLEALDLYQNNTKDKKLFEALIVSLLIHNKLQTLDIKIGDLVSTLGVIKERNYLP